MKQIAFEEKAFEDFTNWATQDKKLYTKIIALIKDIKRNPFTRKKRGARGLFAMGQKH